MATLQRPHRSGRVQYVLVQKALLEEAGVSLSPAQVGRLVELAREQSAADELADAMARMLNVIPPATARAVQAGENAVHAIEDEFGLLTSSEVSALLGSSSSAAATRSLANDMRAAGKLLFVRRLNKFLYPGFQFDRIRGRASPLAKSLLDMAGETGWEPEDVVLWLCSPTTYFEDGSRPVDHFDSDPDRVLDVARQAWAVEW